MSRFSDTLYSTVARYTGHMRFRAKEPKIQCRSQSDSKAIRITVRVEHRPAWSEIKILFHSDVRNPNTGFCDPDIFISRIKTFDQFIEPMYEEEGSMAMPLFCVETLEKRTGRTLYINFKASDGIQEPDVDIDEEKIVQEIRNPSPRIEQFKVPLRISPIFWRYTKLSGAGARVDSGGDKIQQGYVVDVELNREFAFRRVIASDIIRHFVVTVTMVSIEDKFNQTNSAKLAGMYIGHRLDLDQAGYKIIEFIQQVPRSDELVNNKILLVEHQSTGEPQKEKLPVDSDTDTNDFMESTYDLYLRPASMLLTCSIQTDSCPDSISFNDDRVCVELGDKTLLDVYLPLKIDLNEPAKYKFDDRLSLFKIVFKLVEPTSPKAL